MEKLFSLFTFGCFVLGNDRNWKHLDHSCENLRELSSICWSVWITLFNWPGAQHMHFNPWHFWGFRLIWSGFTQLVSSICLCVMRSLYVFMKIKGPGHCSGVKVVFRPGTCYLCWPWPCTFEYTCSSTSIYVNDSQAVWLNFPFKFYWCNCYTLY